jgi:glycosyltransferase involved in cell wall biosynthesis
MRILHFFKTYYPDAYGGIQQFIYQLAESSHYLGVESKVLTLSNQRQGQLDFHHHSAYFAKEDFYIASTGFSREVFADFKRLAQEADIIHYHFPWPFMDMVHFISQIKKPCIVTYHSDIVKQKWLSLAYKPLMSHFLKSVDCIVTTSPNYLQTSPVLQKFSDKTHVVPIGLQPEQYQIQNVDKLNEWKQKLPSKFFLFIGFLRYYKGLNVLLEALRVKEYPVYIIGEGPEEVVLKQYIADHSIQNVHFMGNLNDEDKNMLLSLCTAVVFPSHQRSEAFGITLLEAALFGKPMISCEIGTGTTYINLDRQTGLAIPPDNPTALAAAMHELWTDEEQTKRFGVQAKQRFDSMFTADKMAADYYQLYQQLLK